MAMVHHRQPGPSLSIAQGRSSTAHALLRQPVLALGGVAHRCDGCAMGPAATGSGNTRHTQPRHSAQHTAHRVVHHRQAPSPSFRRTKAKSSIGTKHREAESRASSKEFYCQAAANLSATNGPATNLSVQPPWVSRDNRRATRLRALSQIGTDTKTDQTSIQGQQEAGMQGEQTKEEGVGRRPPGDWYAPGPEFDLRGETRQESEEYVRVHHPELLDLVLDGTLVVLLKRSGDPGAGIQIQDEENSPVVPSSSVPFMALSETGARVGAEASVRTGDPGAGGGAEQDGRLEAGARAGDQAVGAATSAAPATSAGGAPAGPAPAWREGDGSWWDEEDEARRDREQPEVVWLVGTAHLSSRSAQAVRRVIQAVQPDNVVVELCRSRVGAMYSNTEPDGAAQPENSTSPPVPGAEQTRFEPAQVGTEGAGGEGRRGAAGARPGAAGRSLFGISGPSMQAALGRSLRLGGQTALFFRLVLSYMAAKISVTTQTQDREYGAEFQAAREAAEEVKAQMVLGDRPIEITLKRAWQALSLAEKWRMLRVLLQVAQAAPSLTTSAGATSAVTMSAGATSAVPLSLDMSEEALERLQQDDALSDLFRQLSEYFPSLLTPLIYERDAYLAWSTVRSKAVRKSRTVVSVMGKAHLRGVVYIIRHKSRGLRFKLVAGQEDKTEKGSNALAKRIAFEVVLFVVGSLVLDWVLKLQS